MSNITGFILSLMRKNINTELCKMLAALLHSLSLALCTRPCVIAYEVWTILRSRNTRKGKITLYLQYSISSWRMPLILTSMCLLFDLWSKEALIHCGIQVYCWISPTYARLTVYIAPFLLINYGSLFFIFIVMLKTKLEQKKEPYNAS